MGAFVARQLGRQSSPTLNACPSGLTYAKNATSATFRVAAFGVRLRYVSHRYRNQVEQTDREPCDEG